MLSESTEDKQQERCSDGKQQQQATTASVSGNFEKRGNNCEYVLVGIWKDVDVRVLTRPGTKT